MIYIVIPTLLLAADQIVKWYMVQLLPLCRAGHCEAIEVLPVFKFVVLHNEGAAFSFLSDAGGWQRWFLLGISSAVSVGIAVWLYRVREQEKLLALALAFILGGALGNLVDRAYQGYVVDYIVLYYDEYYFPAFNIADSAITVGAGLLILDMFWSPGGKKVVEQ